MEITRINNDINGNPRHVIHFLAFITSEESKKVYEDIEKGVYGRYVIGSSILYELALKKARKLGGGKFHNKQFGGGIVFSCYDRQEVLQIVFDIVGNEMFKNYNVENKHIYVNPVKTFIHVRYMFNDTDICNLFCKNNPNMGVIEETKGCIFVADINDK